MTDERPAPLVPAECDLTGFEFMPLEIERLRKSKAWLRARRIPFLAFHLLNMWMRAFTESPAGSIENDDDTLADAASCAPETWPSMREEVMRGWILCTDNRWHHPVVAEKVLSGWAERLKYLYGKYNARVRQAARRAREDNGAEIDAAKPLISWLETEFPASFSIAKSLFPEEFEALSQGKPDHVTVTQQPVTVTNANVTVKPTTKGEGEGEGELKGETRNKKVTAVAGAPTPPPHSDLFQEFIHAFQPKRRHVDAEARGPWLKLTFDEQRHLPACARAYNADLVAESAGHRNAVQKINPRDWIKKRTFQKYLTAIVDADHIEQQRQKLLTGTIDNWNGDAQALIAKIGAAKFNSLFVPSTLTLAADEAIIAVPSAWTQSRITGDPGLIEHLRRVLDVSVKVVVKANSP